MPGSHSQSHGPRSEDIDLARRRLCGAIAGAGVIAAITVPVNASAVASADAGAVAIEGFSAAGQSQGVSELPKIVRSDAQWQQQLSALAFDVTRRAGTERAFTGALWNQHADGLYYCVCCQTALFDSRTKFESGTGWPSFYEPAVADAVVAVTDNSHGMVRTEVRCRRCGSHLGHVFPDGPQPSGLRYCMNSAALDLEPRTD
jgi:peptide-methionine (R)-S-oxide reductase